MKRIKKALVCGLCAVIGLVPLAAVGCTNGSGVGEVEKDLKFDEFGDPIFFDDNGKALELKVWSIVGDPDNTYLDVVNTMFNDYYRSNGVTAKVTSIANGDFYTQLANTINTDPDNAPDVVVYHSERLPLLASNNILRPLEEFYDALGDKNTFDADNYLDGVMSECYYNGKLYGVPLDVHSGVWFCRTDILEKNGLEVPTSLSEFVDVCNDLIDLYDSGNLWYRAKAAGSAAQCAWKKTKDFGDEYCPVVMSNQGGIEYGWIPQTAVFQNGGTLTDDNGRPAWNTDGLEAVMSMFRDWQTGEGDFKGTPYSGKFVAANNDYNTVWSKLSSGEAVFSFEGPWWIEQRLDEYEEVLGDLADGNGIKYKPLDIINPSKMFALDETQPYADKVYGVGHCFSVSRTVTSETECVAAALYAQFMTENSAEYTRGGHLPASKAVLESDKFKSLECYDKYLKKFTDPEDFVMLGGTVNYSPVYEKLKSVYMDVFTPANHGTVISQLIQARYNEAIRDIDSAEDL